MIPEEWGENTRMSERSFFILHGKTNMCDVINNLITLSYRSKWKQKTYRINPKTFLFPLYCKDVMDRYGMDPKAIGYNGNII